MPSIGVPWYPQILAAQLTLFQPEVEDYARQIILAPPDFQTFLQPCKEHPNGALFDQYFLTLKNAGFLGS